jgi:hypothetical protein
MLHLQHFPSFDDYVQTIKPVINEYQSHQKDMGRFDQEQKSHRPFKFQWRTNAIGGNMAGSESDSNGSESSDADVADDALRNAEDMLLAEAAEEEPVKIDNQIWVGIAMAKLGRRVPTCAICQKDGHVYRKCKVKPDKAAKERIALLHEQLAEWRRKSKEKNKEEKGGDKKSRDQKEKSKTEVKEVLAIEIDDVQNNHIVQTANTKVLDEFDEFFKIEKRGISDEARHLFASGINSVAISELGDFEVEELEEQQKKPRSSSEAEEREESLLQHQEITLPNSYYTQALVESYKEQITLSKQLIEAERACKRAEIKYMQLEMQQMRQQQLVYIQQQQQDQQLLAQQNRQYQQLLAAHQELAQHLQEQQWEKRQLPLVSQELKTTGETEIPMVQALPGQTHLKEEQNFRQEGAAKKM